MTIPNLSSKKSAYKKRNGITGTKRSRTEARKPVEAPESSSHSHLANFAMRHLDQYLATVPGSFQAREALDVLLSLNHKAKEEA